MSATAPGSPEIRDYLLRRMTDSLRAKFEEAYFKDDRLLDRLNELNAEMRLARFFVVEGRVIVAAEMFVAPFVAEHVKRACVVVATAGGTAFCCAASGIGSSSSGSGFGAGFGSSAGAGACGSAGRVTAPNGDGGVYPSG